MTETTPTSKDALTLKDHYRGLGTLVGELQSLELLMRTFLQRAASPTSFSLSGIVRATAGATVPVDSLTDYESLGDVIKRYNSLVPDDLKVDVSLVTLRDAVAHGRLFMRTTTPPFRLVKFARPKGDRVEVMFAEDMTRAWFDARIAEVRSARDRAGKASGGRKITTHGAPSDE